MTDKKGGAAASFLKFLLLLCSFLYGAAVRILAKGYEKNFFTPYKADPKVISVGNITFGGTGKTQAVIFLARLLEGWDKKVSILTRGYGADEYMLLKEELKNTPVLVGQDRIKNSKRAFYDFGADTVILDDAFQHWKIKRDLDIVLVDSINPFGNYRLLPRGILREPIEALKRADVIVVTKVDSPLSKRDEVYNVLQGQGMGKAGCILEAAYKPLDLYDIAKNKRMGLGFVNKKKVCLVSSIGNPAYFRDKIKALGAAIELEYTFMDHYNYRSGDFEKMQRECKFVGAELIIATRKDAVKIKRLALLNELSIPVLALDVEFEVVKNREMLNERLFRVYCG